MKNLSLLSVNKYLTAIKAANLLRNAVYIGVATISVINIVKIYKAIAH